MARQIYQLKITLLGVDPPVWRRLQVPGGHTLDRLHRALQHSFGWLDCHLHSFEIDGVAYGEPTPDGDLDLRDELDTRLDAVAAKGSRFTYTYDFGDWWEHEVLVEDVAPARPEERYPICVAGERAAPPEDVGGAYGYAQFLAAFRDPGHPRHAETRGWAGPRFDPERCDPQLITTLLRRMV